MPSASVATAGTRGEALRRVFARLRNKAEAGDWQGIDELAGDHDRLLREALADPDPDTIAYLHTVREDHENLLDLVVSIRDDIGAQIKVLSKGRKAVAAYR